jgi:hypothetical protein
MEMDPFPKGRKPTLTDAVDRLEQLHSCIETRGKEIRAVDGKVDGLVLDVAHVRGMVDGMAKGLGVHQATPGDTSHKPPKFTIRWDFKTVAAIVGSLSGALLFLKVLNAVIPVVWAALMNVPLQ